MSFKYLREIDDQTQFEVLTYYTDSFRGSNNVVNRWTYNLDMFAQSQQRAPGTGGVYITDPTPDGQYGDIPGYATWSTRVGYDFGPEASNLKVGAGIKNLFNQEYYTRSSDNNSGLYLGEPRTFLCRRVSGFKAGL